MSNLTWESAEELHLVVCKPCLSWQSRVICGRERMSYTFRLSSDQQLASEVPPRGMN